MDPHLEALEAAASASAKNKYIFATMAPKRRKTLPNPSTSPPVVADLWSPARISRKQLNPQTDCPLFKLPTELRLEIYRFLFDSQLQDTVERKLCCPTPPLLQTCRLIQNHGVEVYDLSFTTTLALAMRERQLAYNFYFPMLDAFNDEGWRVSAALFSRSTIAKSSVALRELLLIRHAFLSHQSDSDKSLIQREEEDGQLVAKLKRLNNQGLSGYGPSIYKTSTNGVAWDTYTLA